MYQSSIFTRIVFLALATRMLGSSAQVTQRRRVHRLDTFDPNDESYSQTTDFSHMRWDMLQTLRTIFQPPPIWGQNDHRFWSQIEFKCFLHGSWQHPVKVVRDSSRFIKEDLKFSLGELMMGLDDSARQLLHMGRSGERFGFIIHGWVTSHLHYDIHMKPWMDVLATDLRSKLKMNVIVVEWTGLSMYHYSVASRECIEYVATAIHFAIDQFAMMMRMNGTEYEDFLSRMLIVGHSIGAHAAGIVGDSIKRSNGVEWSDGNIEPKLLKVGTIVGLDPAGLLFSPLDSRRHCLTHYDAQRVLIIHASTLLHGTPYRLGHEDYFIRGGTSVIPFKPGLSHIRTVNLFRALIWDNAIGYVCLRPNYLIQGHDLWNRELIVPIRFRLDLIPAPDVRLQPIPHPIYLPVNSKSPFFDNIPPKRIPAYSTQSNLFGYVFGVEWEKVRFH